MGEQAPDERQARRDKLSADLARNGILHCNGDGEPDPGAVLPPVPERPTPQPRISWGFLRSLNFVPGNPFYKGEAGDE